MVEPIPGGVRGRKHGVEVRVRELVVVDGLPVADTRVVVEATGARTPLTLLVTPELAVLEGEARFDALFEVQGAPADLVRTLLDADVRALLGEVRHTMSRFEVEAEVVRLALRRAEGARAGVDLVALVAARTHTLEGDADAAAARAAGRGGYRGGPERRDVDAVHAARAAELDTHRRMKLQARWYRRLWRRIRGR